MDSADYENLIGYPTETAVEMRTPTLDDTAIADQLAVGTILLVTTASIGGTTYYVPADRIGLY